MMVNQELISLIWEDLVIWAVLVIWVEIKTSSSHLMAKIWEVWVEWIQTKYSKCLWEEEEDLVVVSAVLVREENQLIKHHKQKEKNSGILLSRDLILTALEVQALGHSEETLSKRANRKNDFLI